MKIPSNLIAAWLLLPLVTALAAADTNKMLTVDLGQGKVVEMPDTSDAAHRLNLLRLKLELLYAADFSKPLKFVKEADLFSGGQRTHLPRDMDWVLEGKATARTEEGRLILKNDPGHLTFWNTREFPSNVLIQFEVSPADSNKGLNIVFFAARGRDGGSIFALDQPIRDGLFKNYTSGAINCYHTSYWASDPAGGGARHRAHPQELWFPSRGDGARLCRRAGCRPASGARAQAGQPDHRRGGRQDRGALGG